MTSVKSVLGNYTIEFVDALSTIQSLIDVDNTFTFIDENVKKLYPSLQRKSNVTVKCIESNKTYEMSQEILSKMVELGVKSNSTVVVIGGGILQDLVGFCCSVYNRGITYILVPTTLLAQADSCVGGKTSINFQKKKNILGTFFPPKQIIIYKEFLNTLSNIEYVSGIGEIFKFHILQNKMEEFHKVFDKKNIDTIIHDSLAYKNAILEIDEFDKKERKFLNFGHTFGHALEFTSDNKIPHGVGVILGCLVSVMISDKLGYSVPNVELIYTHAKKLLTGIPLNKEWFDINKILEAVKLDKKNTGQMIDVLIDNEPILVPLHDTNIIKDSLLQTFELVNDETIRLRYFIP